MSKTFEHGQLALKHKLDNEFELVFVVGYQKMLPLLYLDKLLDEIHLRFRKKYEINLKEHDYYANPSAFDFSGDFQRILDNVEKKSKESQESKGMRTFQQV